MPHKSVKAAAGDETETARDPEARPEWDQAIEDLAERVNARFLDLEGRLNLQRDGLVAELERQVVEQRKTIERLEKDLAAATAPKGNQL